MDILTFALCKKYTDETAIEFGGLRGSNASVKSIVHDDVNLRNVVTFEWKNSSDETRESVMYVPDGHDGKGIVSITKTSTSGLIDTYTILFTDDTITTFNVVNGAKGLGIKSTAIDANGHLVITYDDNTTEDAGAFPVYSVHVTQVQTSGTKIAEVEVNGTVTNLYAPSGGGGGADVDPFTSAQVATILGYLNV